jgi:thioredoxin reductase
MFDALIIGGGAAGMSCAIVLGSAKNKEFAKAKKVGLIAHQKTSHLQNALFNNVLGLEPGTLGSDILENGKAQLDILYPDVIQIEKEKVSSVQNLKNHFKITTNKNSYTAKVVVIAVGYTNLLTIKGLDKFIEPHPKANIEKDRIWLKNEDHLMEDGLYVAGTLAGHRSQFAIASGSGAAVATDILSIWNNGKHTKIHDKVT